MCPCSYRCFVPLFYYDVFKSPSCARPGWPHGTEQLSCSLDWRQENVIICINLHGCPLEQRACWGNSCYFSTETSSLKPWLVFAALSTADGAFALVESQLLKYNVEGFSPCKACLYKACLSVDVPLKEYQVFCYWYQVRDLSGKYQEKPCLSSWEKTGEGTQEISVLCVLPRDCKVKGRHIGVQFQVPDCIFSIGFCSCNMQNSCVIPPKSAFSNKYRYVSTHFFSVMERWTEEKNEVRKFHTGYIQEQKTMRLLIKK